MAADDPFKSFSSAAPDQNEDPNRILPLNIREEKCYKIVGDALTLKVIKGSTDYQLCLLDKDKQPIELTDYSLERKNVVQDIIDYIAAQKVCELIDYIKIKLGNQHGVGTADIIVAHIQNAFDISEHRPATAIPQLTRSTRPHSSRLRRGPGYFPSIPAQPQEMQSVVPRRNRSVVPEMPEVPLERTFVLYFDNSPVYGGNSPQGPSDKSPEIRGPGNFHK